MVVFKLGFLKKKEFIININNFKTKIHNHSVCNSPNPITLKNACNFEA